MKKEILKELFRLLEYNESMMRRVKAKEQDDLSTEETESTIAVREKAFEMHQDYAFELNQLIDLYIKHHGN